MLTIGDLRKEVEKVVEYKDNFDDCIRVEFEICSINSELIQDLIEKEVLTDYLVYESFDGIQTVETKDCDNLLEIIENGYTKEVLGDKHKIYDRVIRNLYDTIIEYAEELEIEESK